MPTTLELYDGSRLEFEDGTPEDVIARVAREETARIRDAERSVGTRRGTAPAGARAARGRTDQRPPNLQEAAPPGWRTPYRPSGLTPEQGAQVAQRRRDADPTPIRATTETPRPAPRRYVDSADYRARSAARAPVEPATPHPRAAEWDLALDRVRASLPQRQHQRSEAIEAEGPGPRMAQEPEFSWSEFLAPASAAGRGGVRAAVPTTGAAAAFGPGFTAGVPLARVPYVGPAIPFVTGLAASIGAGYLTSRAQERAFEAMPAVADALGQSAAQRAEDATNHPIASLIGELAPGALFMRPGFRASPVRPDASRIERVLANPLSGSAVGATVVGGSEGARQLVAGDFDAGRLGAATATGAAMNKPTTLCMAKRATGKAPAAPPQHEDPPVKAPSDELRLAA